MSIKTIEEYLANIPTEQREALEVLRGQIRAAAPEAEECISYGQPAFRKQHVICGFGAAKSHCAFYMFNDITLKAFSDDLANYDVSKGTVRFQPAKPLSASLVKKLVKARLEALKRTRRPMRKKQAK